MSGVTPIGGTRSITVVGPLPAGVKPPSTPQQEALYDACKQFEGVFVKQLVSGWMKSARGDDAPEGAQGIYQDMADDTMTSSLVDGGTFGLAGTMYGQLSTLLQAAAPPAAGTTGDGTTAPPPAGGGMAAGDASSTPDGSASA